MNAKEAQQLTSQAKSELISSKERLWLKNNRYIFLEIERVAFLGKSEVRIDLKQDLTLKDLDLDFVMSKLTSQGFLVSYVLERSPFGKREIVINW